MYRPFFFKRFLLFFNLKNHSLDRDGTIAKRANACVVPPLTRRVRQYEADTTTTRLWQAIMPKLQGAGAVCTNALSAFILHDMPVLSRVAGLIPDCCHMFIVPDFLILCDKRNVMESCRCDNETICGIFMKFSREIAGVNRNLC